MRRAICLSLALLLAAVVGWQPSAFAQSKTKPKDPKKDVDAIGERDVGRGVNLYSLEKEIALGRQLAEEVERQAKLVKDPIVSEYINRVGQNLARHSDAKLPFTFKVIQSPEINAFALPGGFCYVYTGLILEAETEAEMAGVLAHEIAHVAARHGTRQASRGQLASLATLPLILATGGWAGYALSEAASVAIPVAFLRFSRSFEREADYLGLQYLYAAGYDPTAFVDFFEKLTVLQKTKPNLFASIFSSHPMTDDRIEAAQKEMQEILPPRSEYLVTTSEFLRVKERLAALLAGRELPPEEARRPRLRRSSRPVEVIQPKGEEPQPAEGEEDERPVLRRSGEGSQGQDQDARPVLRRPEAN